MQPHGNFGKDICIRTEMHFDELSAITYELVSGRTNYPPKHEDMYIKLITRDMVSFMIDMIWFREKEGF